MSIIMILCFFVNIQNIVFVTSEIDQCCSAIADHWYQISICPRFNHHQRNTDIMHFVYLKIRIYSRPFIIVHICRNIVVGMIKYMNIYSNIEIVRDSNSPKNSPSQRH